MVNLGGQNVFLHAKVFSCLLTNPFRMVVMEILHGISAFRIVWMEILRGIFAFRIVWMGILHGISTFRIVWMEILHGITSFRSMRKARRPVFCSTYAVCALILMGIIGIIGVWRG